MIFFLILQFVGVVFAATGHLTLAEALLPSAFYCWVMIYIGLTGALKLRAEIREAIRIESLKHPPGWQPRPGDIIPLPPDKDKR